MACLWPLLGFDSPGGNDGLSRGPLDINKKTRRAAWQVLHLFKEVSGARCLGITSSQPNLVAVAAVTEKPRQTFVYLLNKTKAPGRNVEIALGSIIVSTAKAETLAEQAKGEIKVVPLEAKLTGKTLSVEVPPLSLTRLSLSAK